MLASLEAACGFPYPECLQAEALGGKKSLSVEEVPGEAEDLGYLNAPHSRKGETSLCPLQVGILNSVQHPAVGVPVLHA